MGKDEIKEAKKIYYAVAVVYFLLGIVLMIWPTEMAGIITTVLGIISLVIGIIRLIAYFTGDRYASIFRYDMVVGLLFIGLGLFTLIWPKVIISVLPVIFGLFLIVSSLIKLQNAVDLQRLGYSQWWSVLIMAGISVILGIIIICNPFHTMKLLIRIIGVFFFVDGISSMVSMYIFTTELRKIKKNLPDDIIDTTEVK